MNDQTEKILGSSDRPACIILGIESMTGLGAMRNLARHDIPVIGITGPKKSIGFFSNAYDSLEITESSEDTRQLLLSIGKLARTKPVLFCESDDHLLFLDRNRDLFQPYFLGLFSAKNTAPELINKKSMFNIARDAGLDVPHTFFSDEHSWETIRREVVFPCIVKPLYTQNQYSSKCEVAATQDELMEITGTERFKTGYLIQEIVPGPVTNIFFYIGYFDKDSKPATALTGYKLRQLPNDFGIATVAVSRHNRELKQITENFLQKIGFSGLIDVEFKYDERDTKYKFIEINPRPCGLIELATSSGVDLLHIAYGDMTGKPVKNPAPPEDGILWISILDDLITCIKYESRTDRLVLFDWLRKMFSANSYAIFSVKDIKPFLFRTGEMFTSLFSRR